ncbi:MAG: hypothetical protein JST94_01275 [Bacteroidetes bacterium]|nr:hypothetical protein [Bacteroidota bacterium]
MNKKLSKGQLFDFLSTYEDKSEFDKLFEEHGLPKIDKIAILHFYTLFFIIETNNTLRFYSTTEDFLFEYPKNEIPKQLLDIFDLYTTRFERPFTLNCQKLNYTRAKKIWIQTEEEFCEANPNDSLTITYFNEHEKYSLGLLYIYRQRNGNTERLDLRDIDEEFLKDLFQMNVSYFPDKDFTKPSVFFEFYVNLLMQITKEIPRKIRRIDIETRVVRDSNYPDDFFGNDEIQY